MAISIAIVSQYWSLINNENATQILTSVYGCTISYAQAFKFILAWPCHSLACQLCVAFLCISLAHQLCVAFLCISLAHQLCVAFLCISLAHQLCVAFLCISLAHQLCVRTCNSISHQTWSGTFQDATYPFTERPFIYCHSRRFQDFRHQWDLDHIILLFFVTN
jgi:hypothetical protein